MESLSSETLTNIGYCASRMQRALLGLSALIREAQNFETLEPEELAGVSELVMIIRDEANKVANVLIEKDIVPEFKEFATEEDIQKMKLARAKLKKQVEMEKKK